MSVEVQAGSPTEPPMSVRRRAPRWLGPVVVVVVLAVAGAGCGVLAWAKHYQPLACCSQGGVGVVSPNAFIAGTWNFRSDAHQISNVFGTQVSLSPKPGSSVDFIYDVTNTGHHGVRITRVTTPVPVGPGVTKTALVEATMHGGTGGPWSPFKPFTLAPQQTATFVIVMTFPTVCPDGRAPKINGGPEPPGATIGGFEQIQVDYHAFGLDHSVVMTHSRLAYSLQEPPLCF